MIEIDEPEFSVDSLAARMLEEAERRREQLEAQHSSIDSTPAQAAAAMTKRDSSQTNSPVPSPVGQQSQPPSPPPFALQPPFEPHSDHRYHVNDLLQYHDRNFIQNAYRAILKRGPDATGFKAFMEALRSGRLNKIDILARLRYSSEGRAKKVQVEGLFLPAAIRQGYRVPVLGYLLHLSIALARLPATIRSQQQFEAHALAQQEQLADYANNIRTSQANQAREFSAALARQSAQTQAAARRQQQQQLELLSAAQKSAQDELRDRLAQFSAHVEALINHVEARINEALAASQRRLDLLEAHLATEGAARNQQVEMLARSLKAEAGRLSKEIEQASQQLRAGTDEALEKQQHLRAELVLQGQRVTRLLEEASARLSAPVDGRQQLQVLADEEQHNLDAFYVSFEDQFRGSRAEIKERLKIYLPLLERGGIGQAGMPLLDLGSGRGEWLELLGEKALRARGVDHNRVLAAECRERGLDVVEDELMHYLRGLPDESLGAVTGFHIVEHLPIEILIKMLDETVRVMKPGGAVIFETPNPQNVLVGSCNFYFDPTHRNPLPGPIMRFLVESRGYARVEIINLNPSDAERVEGDTDLIKRFNQYFYGPMDYAVVGWKV